MKKVVISKLVLTILVIAISMSLVGCGPTETQKAADDCLRGNQAACEYHAALIRFEEAEKAYKAAKEEKKAAEEDYKTSLKPTPSSTVTPTVTEENPFLEPTLAPEEGGGN